MRNRVKDNQGNVLANVPTMKRVSTLRILAPFTSFIKSSSPLSDFFLFSFQSNTRQYDDTSQYDDTLCKSLLPRYEDGVLVIPKALVKSPISAYENTLEVFSMSMIDKTNPFY